MITCEGVWMWIVTEREASVQGVRMCKRLQG